MSFQWRYMNCERRWNTYKWHVNKTNMCNWQEPSIPIPVSGKLYVFCSSKADAWLGYITITCLWTGRLVATCGTIAEISYIYFLSADMIYWKYTLICPGSSCPITANCVIISELSTPLRSDLCSRGMPTVCLVYHYSTLDCHRLLKYTPRKDKNTTF